MNLGLSGTESAILNQESLEDRNLLKLRSLDSSCPFFLCSKCYDRKAKIALRTSKVRNRRKTPNAFVAHI